MRTLLVACLLAIATAAGCTRTADHGATEQVAIAAVTVDELDQLLAHHDCQAVDANGDSTRKKMGVIPGAVLLSSMDAVNELPADKAKGLVFYCANTACGASHEAAEKARLAGYKNVKVLPDGIAGWVKAGKTTSSI